MVGTGIEAASVYLPGSRLDEQLAAGLGADPDLPLAAMDEDAVTLTWEALRALPDGPPGDLLLRAPSALETRGTLAHLRATGLLGTPARVIPLAPDTGGVAAVLAAGNSGTLVVADHGLPPDPRTPPCPDSAVALRFGAPAVAEVLGTASAPALTFDRWPATAGPGPDDPRFVEETLVAKDGGELLDRLLKDAGLTAGELAGVVVTTTAPIRANRWARQWQVPAVWTAEVPEHQPGRLAAAALRVTLARLADAGPGAVVAVLDLGWGGDGMLLRAGPQVAEARWHRRPPVAELGLRTWLAAFGPPPDEGIWTAPAKLRRETPDLLRLTGSRCASCGVAAYPAEFGCQACGGSEVTEERLAAHGTVLSHNLDRLFAAPERDVQMIVVELDGGGRFFGQSVAAPRRWARVGDPVRLVLRRLHTGHDLPHYFWKVDLDG